ncbi:Auxin Efflux Carrier [Desulfovibrio sp. X2]|uniref:AEC family transporter n=1 Tax=Desulfovibrio sp. X2 TaxID=941449 RepID=UPI000358A431|nr:AEC family transporter [Desulfovibrio sp. X2]EPR38731.1 Auxin Efflux Carrier [Desulfovibrio sp. X2]
MSTIIQALAPIFLLILLGYALKRRGFPAPGFWPAAEALTYYVLFPALLLDKLARIDSGHALGRMALALILAVCTVSVLLLAARRLVHRDGPAFSSIFQGAIRPNTYVGLSAAAALLGPEGLSLAAVALMTLIPLVNVLSVSVLGRYGLGPDGEPRGAGLPGVLRELARNPLILSCAAGFCLNAAGLRLPSALGETLRVLGSASLPMGLLAVGAGLRPSSVGAHVRGVLAAGTAKLLVLPLLTALFCRLLGVEGAAFGAAVIFTAIPVSASSFILARQMGGDHGLMAAVITAETAAAAATMPLLLSLFPGLLPPGA